MDHTFAPKIDRQSRFLAEKRLQQLSGNALDDDSFADVDANRTVDVDTYLRGAGSGAGTGWVRKRDVSESFEGLLLSQPQNVGARMLEEGKLIDKKKVGLCQEREKAREAEMVQVWYLKCS